MRRRSTTVREPARRWGAVALIGAMVLFVTLALPHAAAAQAPLRVTLLMPTAPPGPIPVFPPGTPITIIVRVENVSGAAFTSAEGTSSRPFWRELVFTGPGGILVTETTQALSHRAHPVLACFRTSTGAPQAQGIPAVPAEVLPAGFIVEYQIDARQRYDLSRTGLYSVKFAGLLQTFDTVLNDCANLGPVVNVGRGAAERHDFALASNTRTFVISRYQFSGFAPPLVDDSACPAAPCRTFRLGSTIPVKFTLLDAGGNLARTAVALIGVAQISGSPPAQSPADLGTGTTDTGNQFRVDSAGNFIFNLDSRALAPGVWRIDAFLDDGTVRSVQIGLR